MTTTLPLPQIPASFIPFQLPTPIMPSINNQSQLPIIPSPTIQSKKILSLSTNNQSQTPVIPSQNMDNLSQKMASLSTNNQSQTPCMRRSNKTVIIDLDETCIHTFIDMEKLKEINIMKDPKLIDLRKRIYVIDIKDVNGKGNGGNSQIWGIERPHLREFLKYWIYNATNIIIWTAGIEPYAAAIVKHIFRGIGKPTMVLSRKDCVNVGSKSNPMYTKPIMKLVNSNYNKTYKNIAMENSFIIDDRIDYVMPNFSNAVVIPPYKPSPNINSLRMQDTALLKIMTWFNSPTIRQSQDIRIVKKDDIFVLQPHQLVCDYSFEHKDDLSIINMLIDPTIKIEDIHNINYYPIKVR